MFRRQTTLSMTLCLALSLGLANLDLAMAQTLPDPDTWLESGFSLKHIKSSGFLPYDLKGSRYQLNPLMLACATGQPAQVIQSLLQSGADVNALGPDNVSALELALSFYPHPEVIHKLLAAGADIRLKSAIQNNLVRHAAAVAPVEALRQMLALPGAAKLLSESDQEGNTPLHLGAMNPDSRSLSLLLTHLGPAIQAGRTGILEQLNARKYTPLMAAVHFGPTDSVRQLLDAGADPMHKPGKRNLLHLTTLTTSNENAYATLELLLERLDTVLLNDTRPNESTPLHFAAQQSSERYIRRLLSAGAHHDLSASDGTGKTPLHYAVLTRDPQIVALLLDQASKTVMHSPDRSGETLLHAAAAMGNAPVVKRLLESGAKSLLNTATTSGATPLMLAVEFGSAETVDLLLKAGADPSLTNHDGQTALDLAQSSGNEACILALAPDLALISADQIGQLQLKARTGNAEASYELGSLCEQGIGMPKDRARAFEYYQQAATNGLPEAWLEVGRSYKYGYGRPQNFFKAQEAYEQANQILKAQNNLIAEARIHELKQAELSDFDHSGHALEWFQSQARQGSGRAMFQLGLLLDQSRPEAPDEAIRWYRRAARHGVTEAAWILGERLMKLGQKTEAGVYLQQAAWQNHAQAMTALAELYRSGEGLPWDPELARYWRSRAADLGVTRS